MVDEAAVRSSIEAIEAELRSRGWWQEEPLPSEAFQDMGAFGMNTMAFPQWLQFVFVPRVRESLEGGGWPAQSHVGTHAIREFDGLAEADRLVTLLCEFDAHFG